MSTKPFSEWRRKRRVERHVRKVLVLLAYEYDMTTFRQTPIPSKNRVQWTHDYERAIRTAFHRGWIGRTWEAYGTGFVADSWKLTEIGWQRVHSDRLVQTIKVWCSVAGTLSSVIVGAIKVAPTIMAWLRAAGV